MPVPARKCKNCLTSRRTTWVIPGKICPCCGVDGSDEPIVTKVPVQAWSNCGPDLVPDLGAHDSRTSLSREIPHREQILSVAADFTFHLDHMPKPPSLLTQSGEQATSETDILNILIWLTKYNGVPLTEADTRRFQAEWVLPGEWLESSAKDQYPEFAWCNLRIVQGNPYLHTVIRHCRENVMTCLVFSANLRSKPCVRGYWYAYDPSSMTWDRSDTQAGRIIDHLLERVKSASSFATHPLLLPVLFLEYQLQAAERLSNNGFSGPTNKKYVLLRQFADPSLTPSSDLPDFVAVAQGVRDAQLHVTRLDGDLHSLKAMLRAINQGLQLLRTDDLFFKANGEHQDCLELRVDFFKTRIATLESSADLTSKWVHMADTMLYNMINQQSSRLQSTIAHESRIIAKESRRDSSAMKTIALLTVVFLPGTFIAALFSTGLFQFKGPANGKMLSDDFWIYWAITLPLTVLTIIVWTLWYKLVNSDLRLTALGDRLRNAHD